MIHVQVDMWPDGHQSKKYNLFVMTLYNKRGENKVADYSVRLFRRAMKGKSWPDVHDSPLRTTMVLNHRRLKVHVSQLIAKAIAALYPKSNPPVADWPLGQQRNVTVADYSGKHEQ